MISYKNMSERLGVYMISDKKVLSNKVVSAIDCYNFGIDHATS
jgi:hypothetical protein